MLVMLFLLFSSAVSAQLVINEVSQGPSGTSKEWVELLVVGNPTCDSSCVDLRGWIIDDNNGTFASGSGTGIADGHMRFSNDPQWACVGFGTIILIYNEGDPETSLPADDETDSNGDCVYVLPGNSTLLEKNLTIPSVIGQSSYNGVSYSNGGAWATVQLNNSNDSYQTRSPKNIGQSHFAVSWGSNNNNTIIYFNAAAGGNTMYMTNSVDDDPFNQANWVNVPVASNQTPGYANNAANATWIASLNNNCTPYTPSVNLAVSNDTSVCGGVAVEIWALLDNDPNGPIYTWSTGQTGSRIVVRTNTDSTFIVNATHNGCSATDSVRVTIGGAVNFDLGNDKEICFGESVDIIAPINGSYLWSNGSVDSVNTVQPSVSTKYILEINQNGCIGRDSLMVNVQTVPNVSISRDTTICAGSSVNLQASGATNYAWSNGVQSASNSVSPSSTTNYILTASTGACTVQDSVLVTVSANDLAADPILTDISCAGENDGEIALINIQGNPSQISLLDALNNEIQSGTGNVFSNLPVGVYAVLLENASACTLLLEPLEIKEGSIDYTLDIVQANCEEAGSVSLISTEPYELSLNGAAFTSNTVFEDLVVGVYTLEIKANNGCVYIDSFEILAPSEIELNIVADSLSGIISSTESVEILLNGGTSPFNWNWTNGFDLSCYDCVNPILTFENSGWLHLRLSDQNLCTANDSIFINVEPELNFGIPNVFTPNLDGTNDKFFVLANGELRNFNMKIFNRWGEKIFETNDNSQAWDGTYNGEIQGVGTYVYFIQFDEFRNGAWKQRLEKGSLTLLR